MHRCDELQEAWNDLLAEANERSRKLELNLKAQQYFFEVTEVEAWMNEKRNILQTKDYGKDEDVARKLLAKHKVSFREDEAPSFNFQGELLQNSPKGVLSSPLLFNIIISLLILLYHNFTYI